MTRRILPFITLAVLFAFCALAQPSNSAAQAKKQQVAPLATKVAITSVTLLPSGCGVEVNCVEVKWSVIAPPANPQVMTFEVGGKLTTQNGSCTKTVNISDNTARSTKLGFFQGGNCTGQVRSADVTVKLFTRDIEGQKVLTSTSNKTQSF
ncbi:MAG: hypothetical protein HYR56_05895 [Acidobacteria bacterium]|nr:hypothetical protein [Acidobacteriota bacterium]MBI3424708.1 hypothetical protein [Acidobacteriota bacterium]